MSTNDKTGEKLVDSMRRTKAAATDKAAGQQTTARAASRRPAQPQARKKLTSKRSPAADRNATVDPYRSGDRVWPD